MQKSLYFHFILFFIFCNMQYFIMGVCGLPAAVILINNTSSVYSVLVILVFFLVAVV